MTAGPGVLISYDRRTDSTVALPIKHSNSRIEEQEVPSQSAPWAVSNHPATGLNKVVFRVVQDGNVDREPADQVGLARSGVPEDGDEREVLGP